MSALSSVNPEREDEARAAIVEACLRMNPLGINQGKSGNVSMRWDRGGAQGLLITPSAMAYERMGIDDVVWMALAVGPSREPAAVDGLHAPSTEWRIHRDLYAARPEAAAVVHAHPPFATTLACSPRVQGGGIPAFHYMVAVAGGDDIRCAPYATFGSQSLSDHALAALSGRRACLLASHGMLAFGGSLEAALALAVEVESLARMYWQALQLGEPVLLDRAEMARVLARFSNYGAG
ncbi:MAG TPA: class II aldolase/adducin family protein [Quisquiliibacterium sp.]|nr:class II aldolase/adducin family protein [Quisquiliibacterium sp.]